MSPRVFPGAEAGRRPAGTALSSPTARLAALLPAVRPRPAALARPPAPLAAGTRVLAGAAHATSFGVWSPGFAGAREGGGLGSVEGESRLGS